MDARFAARGGAAVLSAGIAVLSFTLIFARPPPSYPAYFAGYQWGSLHVAWIVFSAHVLGAVILALGTISDAVTTPRDTTFWAYTAAALWGSIASVLVASDVHSVTTALIAPVAVALLFAALLGAAETVWDNEARRCRGALGWASTPSAHAMWALWTTAAIGTTVIAFLAALAGVASTAPLAARVLFPIAALWWVPVLVACEGLVYAVDASYSAHLGWGRPVRQVALSVAFGAFSVALVLYESFGK